MGRLNTVQTQIEIFFDGFRKSLIAKYKGGSPILSRSTRCRSDCRNTSKPVINMYNKIIHISPYSGTEIKRKKSSMLQFVDTNCNLWCTVNL